MIIVNLPLHYGKAPRWLFERMKKLSALIIEYMLEEFDTEFILEKFSNPLWFQSFGCFLGFDWHSSGLTTTLTAAIKEGLREKDIPIFIAGGKGKTALKTPFELKKTGDEKGVNADKFIEISRLTAKIDNICVQDNHSLYHHTIWFDKKGNWLVVQQGLNYIKKSARRYHIFSKKLKELTNEPHSGIITEKKEKNTLDLVSEKNRSVREGIIKIFRDKAFKEIYKMPERHEIKLSDVDKERIYQISLQFYEKNIEKFKDILLLKGVGAKTLRALTLLSNLLYGTEIEFKDPARYSFAHGGKDGYPYRIQRKHYDKTIEYIERIIKSKKGFTREERSDLLKKLYYLAL